MNDNIIKTERLNLRYFTEDDVEDLLLLFSDPVAMQYFPSTRDKEETAEWINKNIANYKRYGFGLFAVELKEEKRFIGYCGFIPQENVNGRDEVEIGYGLIREYWHKGYATEAAIACRKYGFETLKCSRLISLIRPENTASVKVAKRNGMNREFDIMRWGFIHGVYVVEL